MSEHTEDTPEERDKKAEVLIKIAADKASALEREVQRFRWEVRGYCAIFILFIISQIF